MLPDSSEAIGTDGERKLSVPASVPTSENSEEAETIMGLPVIGGLRGEEHVDSPRSHLRPQSQDFDLHHIIRSRSDSEISFGPTRAADFDSALSSPLGASRPDSDMLELEKQSVWSEELPNANAVAVLAEDHGLSKDQMTERIWALEHFFAHSMREAGGALDKRLQAMQRQIPSIKSYSTILHTTQPLAVLMHRPWFPVLMFLLSAATTMQFLPAFQRIHGTPLGHHKMFRFVPLQSRAAAQSDSLQGSCLGESGSCSSWSQPPIHSFGLLRNRCKIPLGDANFTSDGATLIMALAEPLRANGWYLVTSSASPDQDPVRFRLDGSNDGSSWVQVAGSAWRFSETGRLKVTAERYDTPHERIRESWMDLTTPWHWELQHLVRKGVVMASLALVGASSVLKQYWHCKLVLVTSLSLASSAAFAAAAGLLAAGHLRDGAVGAVLAVVDLSCAWQIALAEFQLLQTLFLAGLAYLACGLVQQESVEAGEQWLAFALAQGWVCMLIAGGLALFSPRILFNACNMVQRDKRQLEKTWADIQEREGSGGGLETLKDVVASIEQYLPARSEIRQCHRENVKGAQDEGVVRRRTSSVEDILLPTMKRVRRLSLTLGVNQIVGLNLKEPFGFYDCGVPGRVDTDYPITSLDQLYAQAAGVDPVLSVKVAEWAKRFKGSFEHFSFRGEHWHHAHHTDSPMAKVGTRMEWHPTQEQQSRADNSDGWFVEIDENVPDDKAELVSSGEIKYTARAIEKLVMCYHMDVSRLLDVCRQRVIFKSVSDLVDCLQAIASDPDITVMAITNRLDATYDATMTLGYRDVKLNVRVVNAESRRLGFETHVCEIQLALYDMLHCQAHARFIQFRNQRLHMSRWAARLTFFLLDLVHEWGGRSDDAPDHDHDAHNGHHHHHQLHIPQKVMEEHRQHVHDMQLAALAAHAHPAGNEPGAPQQAAAPEGNRHSHALCTPLLAAAQAGAVPPLQLHDAPRHQGSAPASQGSEALHSTVGADGQDSGTEKPLLDLPVRRESKPPPLIRSLIDAPSTGGEQGDVMRARAILARVTQRRKSFESGGVSAARGKGAPTPEETPPSPAASQRPERRRRKRSFNDSLGDMEQSVIEQLYSGSSVRLGARLKVLEEHFIRCALRGHGQLDNKKLSVEEAMACTDNDSVLFTSTALRAALSKQRFRRIVLLYALVCAIAAVHALMVLAANGLVVGKRFRLTAPKLRDWAGGDLAFGQEVPDSVFVLLLNGCPYHPAAQRVAAVGPCTLEITLPTPVAVNGWHMSLPQVGAAGQMSDGSPWTSQLADRGLPQHLGEVCAGVVTALVSRDEMTWEQLGGRGGGSAEYADLRPPWSVVLEGVGGNLVLMLGFLLAVMSGHYGRPNLGKWTITWALVMTAIMSLVSAAVEQEELGWNLVQGVEVSAKWMIGAGYLIIPTFLVLAEGRFMLSLVLSGVYWVLCGLVQYHKERQYLQYHLFGGIIQLIPVLVFSFRRRQVLATSLRNIMPNKHRYDRVWSKLQRKEEGKGTVEQLRAVVEGVSAGLPEEIWQCNCRRNPVELHLTRKWKTTRNLNRSIAIRKHETWFSKLMHSDPAAQRGPGVPGTIDRCCPVESLDQLYAQAKGLEDLLQRKVQRWALCSRGCFPLMPPSDDAELQFVRWDQAKDNATLRSLIRWTPLKRPGRAIEKALRSYGGDVSRLMDIARESICFEKLCNLTLCLQIISHDKDVIIERVKNRLDPEHDPVSTGGYRDVALNIRLSTQETRGLGIDTHFCEVQLILTDFAAMKHDQGHKQYVEFRNARGE